MIASSDFGEERAAFRCATSSKPRS